MNAIRLFVGLLVLVAGCAAPDTVRVDRNAASAPAPRPAGVVEQPQATQAETGGGCSDPRASFRPDGATTSPALTAIRQRGFLRVGGQQTYYLLSYRDPVTGVMSGFEVELARAIARAIFGDPEKIQFVALAGLKDRESALADGTVDIVLASMSMTCARWERVAFSTQYMTAGRRLLVPRTSTVAGMDDLGGKKVCASNGSTDIEEITNAPSRPIAVGAANATDCLILLQQGQVDAVSTGENILAGLAAQDKTTRIVSRPVSSTEVGAAMNREAIDLVRFVNGVLETWRSSGEWVRTYQNTLGPSLGQATPPAPVYRD
jgi:polar amino acid transport system substrate-binding protein